jgi:hypothetical protein
MYRRNVDLALETPVRRVPPRRGFRSPRPRHDWRGSSIAMDTLTRREPRQ